MENSMLTGLATGSNIPDGVKVGSWADLAQGIGAKTSPFFNYLFTPGTGNQTTIVSNITPTLDSTTTLTLETQYSGFSFITDPAYGRLLQLDNARVLRVFFVNETTSTFTFRIDGLDFYKNPMTEIKTFAVGVQGNQFFQKAFYWIKKITVTVGDEDASTNINMGVANRFGLPYALTNPNSIDVRPLNNFNPSIWCEGIVQLVGGIAEISSPFIPAFAGGQFTPDTGLIPTFTVLPRQGVIPGTETISVAYATQSSNAGIQSNVPNSNSFVYWRMNYEPNAAIPVAGGQETTPYPSGYEPIGEGGTVNVYSPYVSTRNQYILTSYPEGGDEPLEAPYVSAVTPDAPGTPGYFTVSGTAGSSVLWQIANSLEQGISPGGPIFPYIITADQTAQLRPSSQGYPGSYYSTATASDVRGIVGFPEGVTSTINGAALTVQVWMYLQGADSTYEADQTGTGLYGVEQYAAADWGE